MGIFSLVRKMAMHVKNTSREGHGKPGHFEKLATQLKEQQAEKPVTIAPDGQAGADKRRLGNKQKLGL